MFVFGGEDNLRKTFGDLKRFNFGNELIEYYFIYL